jgi:hypothetical protein
MDERIEKMRNILFLIIVFMVGNLILCCTSVDKPSNSKIDSNTDADKGIDCIEKDYLPTSSCIYIGNVYLNRTSFSAFDRCDNTCTCSYGTVRCTEKLCPPKNFVPMRKKIDPKLIDMLIDTLYKLGIEKWEDSEMFPGEMASTLINKSRVIITGTGSLSANFTQISITNNQRVKIVRLFNIIMPLIHSGIDQDKVIKGVLE